MRVSGDQDQYRVLTIGIMRCATEAGRDEGLPSGGNASRRGRGEAAQAAKAAEQVAADNVDSRGERRLTRLAHAPCRLKRHQPAKLRKLWQQSEAQGEGDNLAATAFSVL